MPGSDNPQRALSWLFLSAVSFALCSSLTACGGGEDNVNTTKTADLPPRETQMPAIGSDIADKNTLAIAGCELYWRRLRREEPTPEFPDALVKQGIDALNANTALVPPEGQPPRYLMALSPGGIDVRGNQVPHPDYIDPWGHPYQLAIYPGGKATTISGGPDGELGTEDDLHFPESPEWLVNPQDR